MTAEACHQPWSACYHAVMANTPATLKPVDLGYTPTPGSTVDGAKADVASFLAAHDPGAYTVTDLYAAYRAHTDRPCALTTFVRCAQAAGWFRYRTADKRFLVREADREGQPAPAVG